jgi:hypothetical protein
MPWTPLNEVVKGRAARNVSAYRKALAEVTQKHVAVMVDVAAPTLSDFNDTMERACLVLAAAGLKVVGQEEKTISPEDMRFLLRMQIRHAEKELSELGDTRPGDLA